MWSVANAGAVGRNGTQLLARHWRQGWSHWHLARKHKAALARMTQSSLHHPDFSIVVSFNRRPGVIQS
jgi:hypothetical protein